MKHMEFMGIKGVNCGDGTSDRAPEKRAGSKDLHSVMIL